MNPEFYKKLCKADLDNIKRIYDEAKHLEITNLIINDYNDSKEDIEKLCEFITKELGRNVPLHFSKAFPYFKMRKIIPTHEETLYKAQEIAHEFGIKNVYPENI